MRELKLAVLGFGNVGKAFSELLVKKHKEIIDEYGVDVKVSCIVTGSKGKVSNGDGINTDTVISDLNENGRFTEITYNEGGLCERKKCRNLTLKTNAEIIREEDYDVLVELTPLNAETGQPAIDHIKEAFRRKKHVVTANKGPIAWAYRELKEMAEEAGVCFFHETTVMDGAPVFNMYDNTLRLAEVTGIEGVLNTTTNYILDEMGKGVSFEDSLKEGRKLGFVESDPSLDIEGWDGAVKITSLVNVLMDGNISPDMVRRKSIADITQDDIEAADKEGQVIKVMCRAKTDEKGELKVTVQPERVDKSRQAALVCGTTSWVAITTDMMGTLSIFENDPDIYQTAYGVFSDTLRVICEKD